MFYSFYWFTTPLLVHTLVQMVLLLLLLYVYCDECVFVWGLMITMYSMWLCCKIIVSLQIIGNLIKEKIVYTLTSRLAHLTAEMSLSVLWQAHQSIMSHSWPWAWLTGAVLTLRRLLSVVMWVQPVANESHMLGTFLIMMLFRLSSCCLWNLRSPDCCF